ncbi:MAG TPA: DinB family protein [Dehalococcoidia bacterium]|nr:DinB family protein [Dehalococcoidia bacterium]
MIEELDFREKGMDRYVRQAVADMLAARDELLGAIGDVGADDWERYVPYGGRTLHDLLAHLATADHAWALAAQDLLKGEAEERRPLTPTALRAAQDRAIARGRAATVEHLLAEMHRRRKLLISLYELLEPRHLALSLAAFGEEHNSVREHIWLGYHDRRHAADIRRALRLQWHPAKLRFLPEVRPAIDALAPDRTLYVVYNVDPARWERRSPVPGWSYRQLLAHIATGDWVFQTQLRHLLEHGRFGDWPDIDAGNEDHINERRFSTHSALVEEYLSMRHETLLLVARLKPKHLKATLRFWWDAPEEERTALDYILALQRHERSHREQLRPAMKYVR